MARRELNTNLSGILLSTDDITALNGSAISAFNAVKYPKKIDFCLFFTRTASNTSAIASFNNKCKQSIVNAQYYSLDNVPLKAIVDENGTLLVTDPYGNNIISDFSAWVNGTIFL